MPYKDPERKRQWEREHREKRSSRRRAQRLAARSELPSVAKLSSDTVAAQTQPSGWKVLLGLAVGIGTILLGAMAGVNLPTGDLGSSPGSGNSTS